MSFDLGKIIQSMGPFALAIAIALAVMAVSSLAIFVERLWAFRRYLGLSRKFGPIAARSLESGEHDELIRAAETKEFAGSPLATILAAGTKTYVRCARRANLELSPVELTRRELAREMETIQVTVRRGLSVLASVGSVAPFVGLLGTVVGIIAAFEGIAREGSGGLGVVSAGIAEALVETALGLVVAIPAVLAFNHLTTRSDSILLAVEHAKGEFLDHLESRGPEPEAAVEEEVRARAA